MINMLICSPDENDVRRFAGVAKETAELESDERWEFRFCRTAGELAEASSSGDVFDIVCLDIRVPDSLSAAEKLRALNPDCHLIMAVDAGDPPEKYIVPSFMGVGVAKRSNNAEEQNAALRENLRAYLEKMYGGKAEKCFVIDSKEGRQLVPYNGITYFESREKKIFLYTQKNEYSFYDALDRLEKELPAGQFARCHRSFIVNRDKISKIAYAKNLIILDGGEMVPLSRTYKSELKEELK